MVEVVFGSSSLGLVKLASEAAQIMASMLMDFLSLLEDRTKSYRQLVAESKPRLDLIEEQLAETKRRCQNLERQCLYTWSTEVRSQCIKSEMELHDKLSHLC